MTVKKYDKLVRNKIPEIIHRNGQKAKVAIVNETEYNKRLKDKLKEETQEFLSDPSIEELADVQEVVLSIAELNGWSHRLEKVRLAKNINRGSFSKRYVLIEVRE